MIDIDCSTGDLRIESNDLAPEDTLATAVAHSLLTDARDDESGERGWWGDCVADNAGDRYGSRLWLLARAPRTAETLRLAQEYAREALAWLVADKAATKVVSTASFVAAPEGETLTLSVAVTLPGGLTRTYNFASTGDTWL